MANQPAAVAPVISAPADQRIQEGEFVSAASNLCLMGLDRGRALQLLRLLHGDIGSPVHNAVSDIARDALLRSPPAQHDVQQFVQLIFLILRVCGDYRLRHTVLLESLVECARELLSQNRPELVQLQLHALRAQLLKR